MVLLWLLPTDNVCDPPIVVFWFAPILETSLYKLPMKHERRRFFDVDRQGLADQRFRAFKVHTLVLSRAAEANTVIFVKIIMM